MQLLTDKIKKINITIFFFFLILKDVLWSKNWKIRDFLLAEKRGLIWAQN